jgi:broad specificity phosphatase PhoE
VKLILIRHGQTESNKLGRIQGINKSSLTGVGRKQAEAAARALASNAPFTLYSSPLPRALQTAEAIGSRADTQPVEVRELIEMDVGEFEGLSGPQLRERFPDVMRSWDEDPASTVMPGGESLYHVRDRAWPTIRSLAERHGSETVVAVTHNFTIHTIVCAALDMPLNNFRKLRIDLGSVTRLEITPARTTLVSLNETWHLK